MEPRAHHVLIGFFTVMTVTVALLFTLWLSKASGDSMQRYYTVVFNEAVRGLSIGSAVQYSGITVGDVINLALDPRDPRKVIARVRVQGNTPIKEDTQARLALTGITGNSVIEFSGGSPDSPDLVAKDDHKDPVIVATPSPIAKLLEHSDNMMADVTQLVMRAKEILSQENAQRLSRMLKNLEQTTGVIASQNDNVRGIVGELAAASTQANSALREATQLIAATNTLVSEKGAPTLGNLDRATASLAKVSASVDQLLLENHAALSGGMQGMNELGPALQELRYTMSALARTVRRLDENPAAYLTGREKIEELEP
jgi:phospholipid/cholesterol/gamma-HCH transport system substrate-binding protein